MRHAEVSETPRLAYPCRRAVRAHAHAGPASVPRGEARSRRPAALPVGEQPFIPALSPTHAIRTLGRDHRGHR